MQSASMKRVGGNSCTSHQCQASEYKTNPLFPQSTSPLSTPDPSHLSVTQYRYSYVVDHAHFKSLW